LLAARETMEKKWGTMRDNGQQCEREREREEWWLASSASAAATAAV
jgi:hypothetical protein